MKRNKIFSNPPSQEPTLTQRNCNKGGVFSRCPKQPKPRGGPGNNLRVKPQTPPELGWPHVTTRPSPTIAAKASTKNLERNPIGRTHSIRGIPFFPWKMNIKLKFKSLVRNCCFLAEIIQKSSASKESYVILIVPFFETNKIKEQNKYLQQISGCTRLAKNQSVDFSNC